MKTLGQFRVNINTKDFVEYAKASGFVQQSIERNGLRTATVAPAGASY
jgi:hypothetical protein